MSIHFNSLISSYGFKFYGLETVGKSSSGKTAIYTGRKLLEQLISLTNNHFLKTYFFIKPINHMLIFIQYVTITNIKKMFCIET